MMLPHSRYTEHDRNLCACGCGVPVKDTGVVPRYATEACRARWVERMNPALSTEPGEPLLDEGPQGPPPQPAPVPAEEIAEVQAEFAQRIVAAPQVEAVLRAAPSGMLVPPTRRSLLGLLLGRPRKVR